MSDEKTRNNWLYVSITPEQRASLRGMAKAEGKTVEQLAQAILAPAVTAEVERYDVAKAKADAEAAAAKAAEKADAAPSPEPVEV